MKPTPTNIRKEIKTGAIFSPDGKYRYELWRIWDESKLPLHFCMLNPSTANETENDPTVERCQRRAQAMGYGGLIVTNIFAYRSTDPRALKKVEDPVGPENDGYIAMAVLNSALTICGWGKHGKERGNEVLKHIYHFGFEKRYIRALKINKDGTPAHPLYIGYNVKPIPIDIPKR